MSRATGKRKAFVGSASDNTRCGVRMPKFDSFDDVKQAAHRHLMKTDVGYARSYDRFMDELAHRGERGPV